MDSMQLLIADLDHLRRSLLQSEEIGEKRFEFFMALVTAAVAGLIALATADKYPQPWFPVVDRRWDRVAGGPYRIRHFDLPAPDPSQSGNRSPQRHDRRSLELCQSQLRGLERQSLRPEVGRKAEKEVANRRLRRDCGNY
jgi:hypothetical protein